jgi:N-acetylglucosamine malate deacetylase 2
VPGTAAAALHELAHPKRALGELPLLLLVAHPDDEVLGLGSRLPHLRGLHVIFATDGAPRDMADAGRLGFAVREDYAAARVREADAALALLDVAPSRVHRLGYVDQETVLDLDGLTEGCAGLIGGLRPAAVITHAYEGGHPDHDAVALAAHLACRRRLDRGGVAPPIVEFAGYHDPDGSGRIATHEFLPAPVPGLALRLKPAEVARKRRAMACYATQERVLRMFRADRERFRAAPSYRFSDPPHPWPPFYERFVRGGLDGARWRRLAGKALERAGIAGPICLFLC